MKWCLCAFVLLFSSCQTLKVKKDQFEKEYTLEIDSGTAKIWKENLEHQQQIGRVVNEEFVELEANDIFFWDPDSGLVSKFGPLKVKFKTFKAKELLLKATQYQHDKSYDDKSTVRVKTQEQSQSLKMVERDFSLYYWLIILLVFGIGVGLIIRRSYRF